MADAPKSFADTETTIRFPGITQALVEIAGMTVARTVQDPGWRWSTTCGRSSAVSGARPATSA